jgi:hypothetical protein
MHHADARPALEAHARERIDLIVDDLMERQWHEVPELWVTDDPAFREAVLRSTRENVELMFDLIDRPRTPPRALCAGARLEADVTAQHGATAAALLRTYHLGETTMVDHFLDILDREPLEDGRSALRELRRSMQAVHAYLVAVMPLVAAEHAAERERLELRPDLRRLRSVQAALAGDRGIALDYPVGGEHHVALVGTFDEADVARTARVHDVQALVIRGPDERMWAWLHGPDLDAAEVCSCLRTEGAAGVGGPASFRAAHEQARLAERIASGRGRGVVDLRSVALEALALGDQRTAFAVARAELGPLAGADQLRDTLETWFATRESVGETAARLGIAPRTVSYRLRRAEVLLGHPIAARRAELEAALRVERLLAAGTPRR